MARGVQVSRDRKARWSVLVTADAFAAAGMRTLRAAGCEVVLLGATRDQAEVEALLASRAFDAVISRTVRLEGAAMRACPSLRVVSKHGAGVDNVDVAGATELGLPVTRTPGANAASVAELAIGLMIASARHVPWLDQQCRAGRWARRQDGRQLAGRRLGVLGYGAVGRRVAALGVALGMDTTVLDPALSPGGVAAEVRLETDLRTLLRGADVCSLHLPHEVATHHVLGEHSLAWLPPGAIVVNTARAGLVDTVALVAALESGHLGGAGLDTVEGEPLPPDHPLHRIDTVVLTPHVGGSSIEAVAGVGEQAAWNALDVLEGRTVDPAHLVNPDVLR